MTFAMFSAWVGLIMTPIFAPFLALAGLLKGLGLWSA